MQSLNERKAGAAAAVKFITGCYRDDGDNEVWVRECFDILVDYHSDTSREIAKGITKHYKRMPNVGQLAGFIEKNKYRKPMVTPLLSSNREYDDVWVKVLDFLIEELDEVRVKSWFGNVSVQSMNDDEVTLFIAENAMIGLIRERVDVKYNSLVQLAFQTVTGKYRKITVL